MQWHASYKGYTFQASTPEECLRQVRLVWNLKEASIGEQITLTRLADTV
jgi:hypothetical protein